jgi:hypothetical protein
VTVVPCPRRVLGAPGALAVELDVSFVPARLDAVGTARPVPRVMPAVIGAARRTGGPERSPLSDEWECGPKCRVATPLLPRRKFLRAIPNGLFYHLGRLVIRALEAHVAPDGAAPDDVLGSGDVTSMMTVPTGKTLRAPQQVAEECILHAGSRVRPTVVMHSTHSSGHLSRGPFRRHGKRTFFFFVFRFSWPVLSPLSWLVFLSCFRGVLIPRASRSRRDCIQSSCWRSRRRLSPGPSRGRCRPG